MTTEIELGDQGFLREVERVSGTRVSECLQCHKCSAGCPIGPDTDLRSSQIMRLVQFGDDKSVLSSKGIWLCASCEACSTRCPMSIDVAGVMDACRMVAKERGVRPADRKVDRFNTIFLESVRKHGRVFETGLMVKYGLGAGVSASDIGKATKLLVRGRLAFRPPRTGGKKNLRKVMEKALKEKQR